MDMSGIPVNALGKEAKNLLSALLNPEKIFHSDSKLPRDWRGLAELCGIRGEFVPSLQCDDPTRKVLKMWSENDPTGGTIDKLMSFFEEMDRFDVLDDVTPIAEKDAEYYKLNLTNVPLEAEDSDDEDILTYDDAKRKMERKPLLTYDAFILFDDEDIDFATNIVKILEGQHNMKLCVKDRDLVVGRLELPSVIKLISTRCRKIIVVVSPAFLRSPTNIYFYRLAELDGLEKSLKKIIPCIETPCEVPIHMRMYVTLVVTRCEKMGVNFYVRLFEEVRSLPNGRVISSVSQNAIKEKSAEPAKPVNHVKFITPDVPEESKQEEAQVSPPEKNIPAKPIPDEQTLTSNSDANTVIPHELKKKRSFKKFIKNIVNPKSKKQEVEQEISADDSVIVKKKSSKKKMVVAN